MLGALDGELLASWASTEAPFEVVARGIRRAAERAGWDARPGEPVLRSLRACRREVEAELKRHGQLRVGRGQRPQADLPPASHPVAQESEAAPADPLRRRARSQELKRARVLFEPLTHSHPKLFRAASCALEWAEALEPDALLAIWDREDRLVARLLRALPFEDRRGLLRTARDLVKAASPFSAGARRLSLRFHRSTLLRRHLGLPPS